MKRKIEDEDSRIESMKNISDEKEAIEWARVLPGTYGWNRDSRGEITPYSLGREILPQEIMISRDTAKPE